MSSARAALLVCDRDAPSNPFLRARSRTTEIGIRVRRDLPDIRQQPARRRTVRRRAQTLPCLSIRSFNWNCASPTSLDSSELARRIGGRLVHAVIARAIVHEMSYCCCHGARSMKSALRRPSAGRAPAAQWVSPGCRRGGIRRPESFSIVSRPIICSFEREADD